ncbi:MAG TPA: DUF1287 domain-containing protein [Beijerinckiaceae bacterium]|nr:DUF1287 domain-containing protein [Beijerinckiaceae bacterium]
MPIRLAILATLGLALLAAWPAVAEPPPSAGRAACVHAAPTCTSWQARLVAAASAQVGVTRLYDPAYARIGFPNGDVPRERGVCTDVIIRAYRDAFGLDLQTLVNADMKRAFSAYPRRWGLARPDTNIDHRRVGNLQVYFSRHGQRLPPSRNPDDFKPGDIISQMLPGNLPHIAVVSARRGASGAPEVIHNIGAGVRSEDTLFAYPITGHYRFAPAADRR